MNRHQRRAVAARSRSSSATDAVGATVSRDKRGGGMHGVILAGGPMDGWVVDPDAPALRPDWHRTLPPQPRSFLSRLAGHPATPPAGRYVVDPEALAPRATWQLIGQG